MSVDKNNGIKKPKITLVLLIFKILMFFGTGGPSGNMAFKLPL
jgi:hypothetical protein